MHAAYEAIFNQNRYELAGDFFEADFREHNLHIDDGVAASIAHQQALGGYPCTILRTVQDEDMWYVHGLYHFLPVEMSVVDIYRLNSAGKVVEHWDAVTCLTDDRGAATIAGPKGSGEFLDPAEKAQRKRLLRNLYDEAIYRRQSPDRFLGRGYIERNQGIGPLAGLRERAEGDVLLDEVRLIGVEGDMACVFSNYAIKGNILHVAEFFRFDVDGLIAEHWDIAHHLPLEAVQNMRAGTRPVLSD